MSRSVEFEQTAGDASVSPPNAGEALQSATAALHAQVDSVVPLSKDDWVRALLPVPCGVAATRHHASGSLRKITSRPSRCAT